MLPALPEWLVTQKNDDDYVLPSLNLAFDATDDVVLRFAAAEVVAWAPYNQMAPNTFLNDTTLTGSGGNADLGPYESINYNVSAEWYFAPGSLLSLGVFQKDISTLSGTNITTTVPFSQLGLPLSLLDGTGVLPSDVFDYRRVVNGDGGEINGVEVNYQHQLRFLPGFLSNLGVLANYTYVDADIDYPAPGGIAGAPPVSGPLTNLSKDAANATFAGRLG